MSSRPDAKMEIVIGKMLRAGVTIAACVVLAGWSLYLFQAHGTLPDYRHFRARPISPDHLVQMVRASGFSDSRAIIYLGILLLIATPIARVLFCVVGFAAQKDKLYVLLSSIVLAVLLYSFFFRA